MSSIKLSPNASGTGIFTIAAPNSNTDRTLTLPDQTGTVLTNAGPFTANASASAGAVTIDASNNVGIGTSSPNRRLHVQNGSSGASNYGVPGLAIESSTNVDIQMMGSTTGQLGITFSDSGNNQAGFIYYQNNGDYMQFATNGSERARIDSSGNLLVNTTAQQTGGNGKLSVAGGSGVAATLTNNSFASFYTAEVYNYTTSTGAGAARYIKFSMGSTPTQTGSIIGDGTNTAYNTSSDYRLKENVAPMTGALALVMQQRPVTWTWKTNGKPGKGFIAHWLQEDGAGECVSGEKDAVDADGNPDYQGVDTSFLVATLTAAIQELKAEVDALKAQLGAQA